MFLWSLASDALLSVLSNFYRMFMTIAIPNFTCPPPLVYHLSPQTLKLKKKKNILNLSFYMHSTKILPQKLLYFSKVHYHTSQNSSHHPNEIRGQYHFTCSLIRWLKDQSAMWLHTHQQPIRLERLIVVTHFFSISIVTLTMLPYVWKVFLRKSSVILYPDTKMVLPCRGLSARPSRFSVRPLSSRSRADTKLSYKFCISTCKIKNNSQYIIRTTAKLQHAHSSPLLCVTNFPLPSSTSYDPQYNKTLHQLLQSVCLYLWKSRQCPKENMLWIL